MPNMKNWLLPDGVFDYLPEQAMQLEMLRRRLTDYLVQNGYQLVVTPIIEYVESLLGGDNADLDLVTFKMIDQLTGRLIGLRADMTPQIARIDAYVRPSTQVARYCYAAEVAHTIPEGISGLRTQFQLGAELFGSNNQSSDVEIIELLLGLVELSGLKVPLQLDIGHVGVFKRLTELAQLNAEQVNTLTELYQRKAITELKKYVFDLPLGNDFIQLAMYGQNIDELRQRLSITSQQDVLLMQTLSGVQQLTLEIANRTPHPALDQVTLDLADLHGYHYHTGLIFALYAPNLAEPLAQGGRYGSTFSNSTTASDINNRHATGFSCYLTKWLPFLQSGFNNIDKSNPKVVLVPELDAANTDQKILLHRAKQQAHTDGFITINELTQQAAIDARVTHRFNFINEKWIIEPL